MKSIASQFWEKKLRQIGIRRTPTRWKQFGAGYWDGLSNVSSLSNSDSNSNIPEETRPTIEKKVVINGKEYRYRETVDGKTIYLFRRNGTRNCFEIEIETNKEGLKYAHLNTFYNFEDCSIRMDSTGSDMLLAVVKLLSERGDLAYMEFSDNSGKQIETDKWITLCDVYFLATGKTWYGSIIPIEPVDKVKYEKTLRKLKNAKWNEVQSRMVSCNEGPVHIPVDISDINTNVPGSAMAVFRRIKDAKTDFFTIYRLCLMPAIEATSFSGSVWRYYFN
jgi:hypothetical protein